MKIYQKYLKEAKKGIVNDLKAIAQEIEDLEEDIREEGNIEKIKTVDNLMYKYLGKMKGSTAEEVMKMNFSQAKQLLMKIRSI